ncbi:MAG: hypothetical protein ACYC35_03375 [Pirellulales bacterium]
MSSKLSKVNCTALLALALAVWSLAALSFYRFITSAEADCCGQPSQVSHSHQSQ